jgi:cell division septation protein DedD
MVMDYSERKPVSKNRPRKQPIGAFILLLIVAGGVVFAAGVATGWFFFSRHAQRNAVVKSDVVADASQKSAEARQPSQGRPAAGATATPPQEPSLTFYDTLPKGSKAVIGSGLNPHKPAEHVTAKAAPPLPAGQPSAKPAPVKSEVRAESVAAAKEGTKTTTKDTEPAAAHDGASKESNGKGKFAVQVASYHTKKDAEALLERLKTAGAAAYIVETNIPDKGTWYRVRIGKHLDQQTAHDLAAKAGKGSIVISE